MRSPAELRQQSEELYAVIDDVLAGSTPTVSSGQCNQMSKNIIVKWIKLFHWFPYTYRCVLYILVVFQIAAVVQNVDPECGFAGELYFFDSMWHTEQWANEEESFFPFLWLASSVIAGQFTVLTDFFFLQVLIIIWRRKQDWMKWCHQCNWLFKALQCFPPFINNFKFIEGLIKFFSFKRACIQILRT